MGTWKSRGLRGSVLEELINRTNEKYRDDGLCLIQKVPTPITPMKFDADSKQITLAYFEKKSTVDYIGSVQGIPVCFDAKESASDTFSLQNIHPHQVEFMRDFEAQDGLSFFVISFTSDDSLYFLSFDDFLPFWERAENGGRKSFRRDELNDKYYFRSRDGYLVPYLDGIKLYLEEKDKK